MTTKAEREAAYQALVKRGVPIPPNEIDAVLEAAEGARGNAWPPDADFWWDDDNPERPYDGPEDWASYDGPLPTDEPRAMDFSTGYRGPHVFCIVTERPQPDSDDTTCEVQYFRTKAERDAVLSTLPHPGKEKS